MAGFSGTRRWYAASATIALAALVAIAAAPPGDRGDPNSGVMPPQSHPFGKSYGEWGAAWQQWIFMTTTANCPATDNTGPVDAPFCEVTYNLTVTGH